jgi:hypothetical protein
MRSRQYPDEMGSISGHAGPLQLASHLTPNLGVAANVELDLELKPIGLDFPGSHAESPTQKMQPMKIARYIKRRHARP